MKKLLRKQRQLITVYIVWFFLNLVVLFMSDKSWSSEFWPFAEDTALLKAYDFSEFLVYAIGPAVLFFAYLMFSKKD